MCLLKWKYFFLTPRLLFLKEQLFWLQQNNFKNFQPPSLPFPITGLIHHLSSCACTAVCLAMLVSRNTETIRLKEALWNKPLFLIQAAAVICLCYRLMNNSLSITREVEGSLRFSSFHKSLSYIQFRADFNHTLLWLEWAKIKNSELRYLHEYIYMGTSYINSRALNVEKSNSCTEWFSWLQRGYSLRHLYPIGTYV